MRSGVVSQSARSIDSRVLLKLYEYNEQHKICDQLVRLGIDEHGNRIWAGARQRMMMSVAYVLSFLCLLRFDEVLRIQAHHIELIDEREGKIKLMLQFRKTHQEGGAYSLQTSSFITSSIQTLLILKLEIKPFYLYWNRKEPHLDATHLLCRWLHNTNIKDGFIFRRFDQYDRIESTNRPMVRLLS